MFEEDQGSKLAKYAGMAVAAAAALWVGTYIVRSAQNSADIKAAEKVLNELAQEAGQQAAVSGQQLMQPVQDATTRALNDIQENFNRTEAERRKKIAADGEARTKKAYSWKDKDGVPHISDAPPPEGTAGEVTRLY